MKVLFLFLSLFTIGCTPYKPETSDTQVVHGKSIIVPPEFNQLPKEN